MQNRDSRAHNGTVAENLPARGRSLAVDNSAESASDDIPGFLARPRQAPVYHGFKVLNDVVVDGFILGAITDFEAEQCGEGDAFVIAPDDSRAGLVWKISSEPEFAAVCPASEERWGVWAVAFPFEMTSRENARLNLETVLPQLKPKWEQWRQEYRQADQDRRDP